MIDIEKLADQFIAASPDDWRRLVDDALGSRSFEQVLHSFSYDHIVIEPLYTSGGGEVPTPPGMRSGPWDIRALPLHPDAKTANREILDDLEGGASSVHLRFHPASWGSSATGDGVVIGNQKDFRWALHGLLPEMAAISLDPGPDYLAAVGMLSDFWAREAEDSDQLRGSLGIDPLGALAAHGQTLAPLEAEMVQVAVLAELTAERWGKVRAISVDTTVYHNAGASEAQELAAALASGAAYLKAMEAQGLALELAADQISFRFAVDTDVLMNIAKLRAFRFLWQGLLESCGVGDPPAAELHILSSNRMLSRYDPWVNILRTTVAGFTAGVAGADAITLAPFTAARGIPDRKTRRLARNSQLLLIEESNLHRVVDPLAGAHSVEALTSEMGASAWRLFQEIEGQGGMAGALRSGWLRRQIAGIIAERWRRLRCREELLTGISSFPKLGEAEVRLAEVDPKLYAPRERGQGSTIPIEGFDIPAPNDGPGEAGEPFLAIHLAAPFEDLRDRALEWAEKNDRAPRVFMANLGRPSDFIAPANSARNLFASAGFEAIGGDGYADDEALLAALGGIEAEAAVICGAPDECRERAGAVIASLREAAIEAIYLAGEPEILSPDDQGKLSGAFYDGVDSVAELEALIDILGGKK